MQRGELDGIADLSWSELQSKNQALLRSKSLRFVLQHTQRTIAGLPGIPNVFDYVSDPVDRTVAELYYKLKEVARPMLTGPQVPFERVQALQAAFQSMTMDSEFRADAARNALELRPSSHTAVETFLSETSSAPAEVRQRLTAILNPNH